MALDNAPARLNGKPARQTGQSKIWAINNTKDLRSFLIEQMKAVAKGEIDTQATKGICNLAQQVYNTLNIELKAAAATAKLGDERPIKPVEFNG